jgi:agmatine deiminase
MAFPREGYTMGDTDAAREECYSAWTEVAHAIVDFEPVSMVVDPTEIARAQRMLSAEIEIVEAPLDEFWMRDFGPTFVLDDDRPAVLGAVDWTFNGWGSPQWAEWTKSAEHARLIAPHVGAELISSTLVNEGAAFTSTAREQSFSPRRCSSTRAATRTQTSCASRRRWPAQSERRTQSGCPGV